MVQSFDATSMHVALLCKSCMQDLHNDMLCLFLWYVTNQSRDYAHTRTQRNIMQTL